MLTQGDVEMLFFMATPSKAQEVARGNRAETADLRCHYPKQHQDDYSWKITLIEDTSDIQWIYCMFKVQFF